MFFPKMIENKLQGMRGETYMQHFVFPWNSSILDQFNVSIYSIIILLTDFMINAIQFFISDDHKVDIIEFGKKNSIDVYQMMLSSTTYVLEAVRIE